MHLLRLTKPDGRALILYGHEPLPDTLDAPSANTTPINPNSHLRWHPLRGEWVAYAGHRQNRTFLPPPEYNPLAPSRDPQHPTEVPEGPWDVAVFENLFPTLTPLAHDPPQTIVDTRPGKGACEVVVFTQDATASLGTLPLRHLELLIDVWAQRYEELGARDDVQYVFPFENRGVEVGVTLHHPHGQIYAYPFVPPIAARELAEQRAYLDAHGRGLLADHLQRRGAGRPAAVRVLGHACRGARAGVRALPVRGVDRAAARGGRRWPTSTREERADFARALKTVLLKYDGLWQRPFPYIMVFHQAPTDGVPHPEAHVHVEFYPAYRMPNRLKFLAGSETGAGVFTADTLPDEKAAELRAVEVTLG